MAGILFAVVGDKGTRVVANVEAAPALEIRQISRTVEVYQVLLGGKSIGTINAACRGNLATGVRAIHAMDPQSRTHYAESVEACAQWLRARAENGGAK